MVAPEGRVSGKREIHRDTIYCNENSGEWLVASGEKDKRSSGGPVGGFVVAGVGELVRLRAIGEHGPDLAAATASGFKDEVAAVGSPGGAFVAALIASEFADLAGGGVHDVDVIVAGRAAPGESG